ncbi:hypothetical protein C725_0263 [Pacificimonas flava]|uniref:non-specific protein-tyrosine kinase n=1 Tax=Pacificimonas flava TaxID=1234595 RepID=M2U8P2_9SPHN|nr:hypothetical protein C725_0263 [Pacificimonas flava]
MTADFAEKNATGPLLDFGKLTVIARRRIVPMAVAAALCALAVAALYFTSEPTYSASGQIGFERGADELLPGLSERRAEITDAASVETAVQALRAPEIATAVARTVGPERILRAYMDPDQPIPTERQAATRRAAAFIRGGLSARREGTSFVITIASEGPDPEIAAAAVNSVIDIYVGGQVSEKSSQRQREISILRERIAELKTDLQDAETQVANYRARTNLVDIKDDSTAAQQILSQLGAELAQAEAEQAVAESRAASPAAAIQSSSLLRELRAREAALSAERADLAGRYGERHPSLANIDRQLSDLNERISEEIARERDAARREAQTASRRTASIRSSLNDAQSELLEGNNASVRLAELERNAEAARALYESFLSRLRENVAAAGTEQTNAYPLSRASAPRVPASPSLQMFGLIGLMGAGLAAAATAAALELREQGYRSRREVERHLGLPVLASVADVSTVPDRPVRVRGLRDVSEYLTQNDGSVFNEAFRSLRTALHVGRSDQIAKSIAVCSALPSEGKTTTALCLAWSAAMAGHKTIILDCDHRRATFSRSLSKSFDYGLGDVLNGEATLEEAIIPGPIPNAFLLPQRSHGREHLDVLLSQRMQDLIAELQNSYDFVILDTPPILPVAESRALSAMVEAAILVVRWRGTTRESASQALEELHRADANLIGAVLSKVDLRKPIDAYESGVYYYEVAKE